MTNLDALTRRKSAFESFQALLDAPGHYRPTIMVQDPEDWALARAYDAAQAARGDARRAFTGSTAPRLGDTVRFHAQNAWRRGLVVQVGPKRLHVEYVTKVDARAAKASGRPAHRTRRIFRLDDIQPAGGTDLSRTWQYREATMPRAARPWHERWA